MHFRIAILGVGLISSLMLSGTLLVSADPAEPTAAQCAANQAAVSKDLKIVMNGGSETPAMKQHAAIAQQCNMKMLKAMSAGMPQPTKPACAAGDPVVSVFPIGPMNTNWVYVPYKQGTLGASTWHCESEAGYKPAPAGVDGPTVNG